MQIVAPVVLALALALPSAAVARGGGGHHRSSPHYTPRSSYHEPKEPKAFHEPKAPKAFHEPKAPKAEPKEPKSSFHEPEHPRADPGVARADNGKILRSKKARDDFMHQHPCPATGKRSGACPGFVVDHVRALKHGGQDDPGNMQWQTVKDAKAKDSWE